MHFWSSRRTGILVIAIGSLAYCAAPAAADCDAVWQGASGQLPDQVDPPWTLVDSADPEAPALSGGILTLSTSANDERMYYRHDAPLITPPDPLVIEARMRFVSGSTSHVSRAPVNISFTVSPGVGNDLFIGQDEIFLLVGNLSKGPSAAVDTDGAFHTYRIEVSSGSIDVFYDDVLMLQGTTFTHAAHHGPGERILWGQVSVLSRGTTEWAFVRHNASAECVPAVAPRGLVVAAVLCCIVAVAVLRVRRRAAV